MSDHGTTAEIRAGLDHPIVDADGHWIEHGPALRESMQRVGGKLAVEGLEYAGAQWRTALSTSVAERTRRRMPMEAFWGLATGAADRATVMMPRLLYQRLDE